MIDEVKRDYSDEQIDKLAHRLQGTCDSIEKALEELEFEKEMTISDCNELDQKVFCCEVCEWWYEISEMDEENEWECCGCNEE